MSGPSERSPRDPLHRPGDTGSPRPGRRPGPTPPHSGEPEGGTRRSVAYCSANDRNVPVLVRLGRRRMRGRPSYRDAERVQCLDYGVRCTGFLCPLFDVPTLEERELTEEPHRRIS